MHDIRNNLKDNYVADVVKYSMNVDMHMRKRGKRYVHWENILFFSHIHSLHLST